MKGILDGVHGTISGLLGSRSCSAASLAARASVLWSGPIHRQVLHSATHAWLIFTALVLCCSDTNACSHTGERNPRPTLRPESSVPRGVRAPCDRIARGRWNSYPGQPGAKPRSPQALALRRDLL